MSEYVRIFDTTLRDGEQSPGFSMNKAEKLRMAQMLIELGVDVIEAGFPAASPDDGAAVQEIARMCANRPEVEICGLCRAIPADIQAGWDSVAPAASPRLHTFIATSPVHMEKKLKKTPAQVLETAEKAVRQARGLCSRVDFSPEDAGRSDRDFLKQVVEVAIAAGADVINIPDTVGYLTPAEFGDLIAFLMAECRGADGVIFSTHTHDDLGLGVANAMAGVLAGARQVECTIGGIGERAGNAALEEVVMGLHTRPDSYGGLTTRIKTPMLCGAARLLKSITGQPIAPNKAIIGRNAFAHEAGIHQHGLLAARETYEIMRAEDVGAGKSTLVLGKHSGRAALQSRLLEMGHHLADSELDEVFLAFKTLADTKKDITNADLEQLVRGQKEEGQDAENAPAQTAWKLVRVEVSCGNAAEQSVAKLVLSDAEGNEHRAQASGVGPVDAAYGAVEAITGKHGTLTEFRMDAVTEGLNAQAVVSLTLQPNEAEQGSIADGRAQHFGRAGDADIVVASVKAYLSALNAQQSGADRLHPQREGV